MSKITMFNYILFKALWSLHGRTFRLWPRIFHFKEILWPFDFRKFWLHEEGRIEEQYLEKSVFDLINGLWLVLPYYWWVFICHHDQLFLSAHSFNDLSQAYDSNSTTSVSITNFPFSQQSSGNFYYLMLIPKYHVVSLLWINTLLAYKLLNGKLSLTLVKKFSKICIHK